MAGRSSEKQSGSVDTEQFGRRRFSSRRVYDRRINIVEEAPERELSIPDRSERPHRGLRHQGFDEAPAPDIGRRTGSPHPSRGPRSEQPERPGIGRNWLVDAVLNPDRQEIDDLDQFGLQEDAEEIESGWGWLADSIDISEPENDNRERGRDELPEDSLTEAQRELLMDLLGLSDEESNDRDISEQERADDDIFVDHGIEGRERELFVDHLGANRDVRDTEERGANDVEGGERDDFVERLAHILGNGTHHHENDDVRMDSFSRDEKTDAFFENGQRNRAASDRESQFSFQEHERGSAFDNRSETASTFRSAFDNSMDQRFQSHLADQQPSHNDSWGVRRNDSGRSSFGTPIRPIFDDSQHSDVDFGQWETDYNRDRDADRRRDRSLPSSIEQWR